MAKKKHAEEHENHERWLVSYADFITLLFAFFTILYATSQKDISKAQEFQKSVQKAFRSYIDFGGLQGKYVDTNEATQYLPPPIDVVPQEGLGPLEMKDIVERDLEQEEAGAEEMREIVEINSDSQGVRLKLTASSFFDPGSALIKEDALPYLNRIGHILLKTKNQIVVEGHTDNSAMRSAQFASNWELSATRAATLARYFIVIHKIQPSRLIAIGYADQRPKVPNDSPENRMKNRRVEILLVTAQKKQN